MPKGRIIAAVHRDDSLITVAKKTYPSCGRRLKPGMAYYTSHGPLKGKCPRHGHVTDRT